MKLEKLTFHKKDNNTALDK